MIVTRRSTRVLLEQLVGLPTQRAPVAGRHRSARRSDDGGDRVIWDRHPPTRHPANPLLPDEQAWGRACLNPRQSPLISLRLSVRDEGPRIGNAGPSMLAG